MADNSRCPKCDSDNVAYLEKARVYKCYAGHKSPKFSLKVGTIFEDSAAWAGEMAPRCLAAIRLARMGLALMSCTGLLA